MSDENREHQPPPDAQRCAFVAIIGAPNAGKSTLVNALVGAKVSIVSHKVQTTRVPLRGIATEGDSQLVFIDTPGVFAPKKRLDTAMVEAAWGGARDADNVVLVIDAAKGIDEEVEGILRKLADVRLPRLAVLNKIDKLTSREKLLELAADLGQYLPFERVFMISATDGDGVADLKRNLAERAPPGPWHYAADDLTDAPMRMHGGRNHAREDLPPPARRAAIRLDGRDNVMDRAPRRLGAHRADHLRRPRRPESDHAWQGRADD